MITITDSIDSSTIYANSAVLCRYFEELLSALSKLCKGVVGNSVSNFGVKTALAAIPASDRW